MTVASSSLSTRTVVREARLSQAAVMLTAALDVSGALDRSTLARFRAAITSNIAAAIDEDSASAWSATLGLDANPPKPLRAAAFSVRVRWSEWFAALSPAGAPLRLVIKDDRTHQTTTASGPVLGLGRAESPVSSLGRSSSCSSIRSAASSASSSTAPTSANSSTNCSPTVPLVELANLNLGNGVIAVQQQRRVRRQRGGVKQKQRGIHVDKNKIDVTPYDNGVTGVLTGGVMLGRRPRLAHAPLGADALAPLFLNPYAA